MFRVMGVVTAAVAVIGSVSPAWANPWYARGTFNGWAGTASQLIEVDPGHFEVTVTGLTAGDKHLFKITNDGWTTSYPNGDGRTQVDASGEITFHYYPGAATDGWSGLAADRVGVDDFGAGWEIMGAFNGWTTPFTLTDADNDGIFTADLLVAAAGAYEFKFRKTGDWDVAFGDNGFNSGSGNLSVTTASAGETLQFSFDPAGGRYLVAVPEPASLALVALGGVAMLRRRK